MIKRLSGTSFTPSVSQSDAKWAAASSKRMTLLRNSDWTQLRDVHSTLSPEVRLAWDLWRQQLRSTKRKQFGTPEEFDTAIDALRLHVPSDLSAEPLVAPPAPPATEAPKVLIPESVPPSQVTRETIVMLAENAVLGVYRAMGVNYLTLNERMVQAQEAYMDILSNSAIIAARYPMMVAIAESRKVSLKEAVSDTFATFARVASYVAQIESRMAVAILNYDAETHEDMRIEDIEIFATGLDYVVAEAASP
jgi:hypothetical protein